MIKILICIVLFVAYIAYSWLYVFDSIVTMGIGIIFQSEFTSVFVVWCVVTAVLFSTLTFLFTWKKIMFQKRIDNMFPDMPRMIYKSRRKHPEISGRYIYRLDGGGKVTVDTFRKDSKLRKLKHALKIKFIPADGLKMQGDALVITGDIFKK